MDSRYYWIWLQTALGIKADMRIDEILADVEDAREIYESSGYERRITGAFTNQQLERLEKTPLDCARPVVEQCDKNGWKIITPKDENYPRRLLDLRDYPIVLYVDGDLGCLKDKMIVSVVGSRSASLKSMKIASMLSASISKADTVIVSGGALGIDSAAHIGAMKAGGETVAVLGCGLNFPYLMSNKPLRDNIAKHGALVSEFPPETQAGVTTFPIRNRIISGMSYATVVVEAGERSGSLVTARYAQQQGRGLFAVPGDLYGESFSGTNKLISGGAGSVFSAADVLSVYGELYPDLVDLAKVSHVLPNEYGDIEDALPAKTDTAGKSKKAKNKKEENFEENKSEKPKENNLNKTENPNPPKKEKADTSELSREAVAVYEILSEDPMHIDDIIRQSGLSPSYVTGAVSELEIFGFIEMKTGKRYIKI